MDIVEAIKVQPGEIILFENGKAGSTFHLRSSQHCTDDQIKIFSGVEYIVSAIGGMTKSNTTRFHHATKGKKGYEHQEDDPLVDAWIELEVYTHPLASSFFKKPSKDFKTELDIDNFLEEYIFDFLAPHEFLVELARQAPDKNAYNVSIDDYMWYLNLELNETKNNSMEIYEEEYIEEKERRDEEGEDMPYTFSEGYEDFKEEIRQRKTFFEGTRNICEVLTKMYQLKTYGEVITQFSNGKVEMKDIRLFYNSKWLGKKEFQNALVIGYKDIQTKIFEKYEW